MKRSYLFRFRATLALIAIFATILIFGPRIWHRHKVNQAVATVLASAPGDDWAFGPYSSANPNDLLLMMSNSDRVFARLYSIAADRAETLDRQRHALALMETLASQPNASTLRSEYVTKLIRLVTHNTSATASNNNVLGTIAKWIPATGITSDERNQLFAASQRRSLSPAWAKLLIAIGGRREILYVLQHGGTHDPDLLNAIHDNSRLPGCHWRGLLPYLKKWLADPTVANAGVMRYWILSDTADGRRILLDYALDPQHPMPLRKQAIDKLQQTFAGIDLLLDAAKMPQAASTLNKVAGGSLISAATAAQKSLQHDFIDCFWTDLIDGLSPTNWSPPGTGPKKTQQQFEEFRQQEITTNLAALRRFARRDDLTTIHEWRQWLKQTRPKPPTEVEMLKAFIDHPNIVEANGVRHWIVPDVLGEIPPECLPLYKQLLKNDDQNQQFWASNALLTYSDDVDAVPTLIHLIRPSKKSATHWDYSALAAWLLRWRFADNYFWDADAWQKWWQSYDAKSAAKESLAD